MIILKNMRSWDSICGDCRRFEEGWCKSHLKPADREDCFAAICREFKSKADAAEYEMEGEFTHDLHE